MPPEVQVAAQGEDWNSFAIGEMDEILQDTVAVRVIGKIEESFGENLGFGTVANIEPVQLLPVVMAP